jgi:hypothetical protein
MFSEGVLPNDLVVTNGKDVAAEDVDATAIEQSASQPPIRHATVIGDHEMTAIAPVRVSIESNTSAKRGRHRHATDEPTATGLGSARGVENAIVRKQAHQPVNVMTVLRSGVINEQTFEIVAVHIKPSGVEIESS